MKMNKKGFTLIELLAVIIILAIIALIAVPQVIKILNDARRSAAEDSAYGVLKSAESFVATYMMDNQGDWLGAITFECKDGACTGSYTVKDAEGNDVEKTATLDFKGTKPTSGKVDLDSNGVASINGDEPLVINSFTCEMKGTAVDCGGEADEETTNE